MEEMKTQLHRELDKVLRRLEANNVAINSFRTAINSLQIRISAIEDNYAKREFQEKTSK